MMAAILALALLQDPDAWAAKLADADPGVRDEASAKLMEAGEAALAALDKLAASEDMDVKLRASMLSRRIRQNIPLKRLLEIAPPMEIRAGPLDATLAALSDHFKIRVTSKLKSNPTLKAEMGKATLLEALDAIAREMKASYAAGPDGIEFVEGRPPQGPAAYVGPFKIAAGAVSRYTQSGADGVRCGVTVVLESAHARGLMTLGAAEVTVSEAEWDTGEKTAVKAREWYEHDLSTRFDKAPAAAKSIKILRGVVRLQAPSDWKEWTLDSAEEGASVDVPGGKLVLDSVRGGSYGAFDFRVYHLAFRSQDIANPRQKPEQFRATQLFGDVRLLSAEGKDLRTPDDPDPTWTSFGMMSMAVEASILRKKGTDVWPKRLQIRLPAEMETRELPFEIGDVPLP